MAHHLRIMRLGSCVFYGSVHHSVRSAAAFLCKKKNQICCFPSSRMKFLLECSKTVLMIAPNSVFGTVRYALSMWRKGHAVHWKTMSSFSIDRQNTVTWTNRVTRTVIQHILWGSQSLVLFFYRNNNLMAISMLRLWKGHANVSRDSELAWGCTGLWQCTFSQDGWRL